MKQELVNKTIDQYDTLQQDSKNTAIWFDRKKLAHANITLLRWLKGVEGMNIPEDKKQDRRDALKDVLYLFESHKKLEQENFTLQREVVYLKRELDRREENKMVKENKLLKEYLLNLSEQVENYEKVLELNGLIKIETKK